ncbi:MAG: hypothetical protein Q8P67_12450, partial [archaeon]|nr:hypothetical protein [archaeon]
MLFPGVLDLFRSSPRPKDPNLRAASLRPMSPPLPPISPRSRAAATTSVLPLALDSRAEPPHANRSGPAELEPLSSALRHSTLKRRVTVGSGLEVAVTAAPSSTSSSFSSSSLSSPSTSGDLLQEGVPQLKEFEQLLMALDVEGASIEGIEERSIPASLLTFALPSPPAAVVTSGMVAGHRRAKSSGDHPQLHFEIVRGKQVYSYEGEASSRFHP